MDSNNEKSIDNSFTVEDESEESVNDMRKSIDIRKSKTIFGK